MQARKTSFEGARTLSRRAWLQAAVAVPGAALLASCASPADKPAAAAVPRGPFFYPLPPAAPRLQHLMTLSGEQDLLPARSGFAEFVAGKPKKQLALMQPYGVALHEGRLYVADTGAPGMAVFDLEGRTMKLLHGAGAGRMRRPINVSIDADGTRYVTDTGADQVLVYDRDDRFVRAIGTPGALRPTDVAIDGDRLFVVDILNHQVQVLDKASGALVRRFGEAGSGKGQLFHPTNLAVAPGGDLLVVETGNFRVQRFSPQGEHVRFYGQPGNTPGSFARPKGIAVDRGGRLYVGDAAFQNVQIFEPGGRLLMDFGSPLEGLDGLNLPAAVRIDHQHVGWFQRRADPGFTIEHLVLVVSQYGPNKVDIYGFGHKAGVDYESPAASGKK